MLPPKFVNVRQPQGSRVCTACVAAIATGTTLEQAEAGMTKTMLPDGTHYYTQKEMLKYLGAHGILTGLWFTLGGRASLTTKLVVDPIPITEIVAIVHVKSFVFKKAGHSVFWDGKHILDPLLDEPRDIGEYYIIELNPLIYIDEIDFPVEELLAVY